MIVVGHSTNGSLGHLAAISNHWATDCDDCHALPCKQNRSIGWDIVITPEGPGLIEGNHDWCKLVWQLPVGRGLKLLLERCG